MSRQFKNRKAVDPYGKDYSQIPDEIQWGDMMISKDATPEAWERYAAKIKAGEESPKPYRNSMRQRTDRELIERGLADNEAKLRYSYNSALQKKESNERLLKINTLEDARREFPNRPDDELQQILATTNKTRKYLEADAKKYAATGGGFPTYEEWKIQAEAGEKEHQRRMQAQTQPLRSVPEGTIREPLFGRNPDGSPKPRPKEMDAAEVLALAQEQERKYNPPQKATKKTASSTSAKPASTPPGVIGYDALNQPVYGRTAPTKKATPDFLNAPKPSAFIETPKQPPNSSSPGYGTRIGQPAGTFNTMDFIDRNRDGTDDRYQAGPNKPSQKAIVLENAIGQGMNRGMSRAEAEKYAKEEMASTNYRPPSEGASNLNPNGFPVYAGYKAPPEYYAKSGEGWTKDAFDKMNAVNKYRADLAQQEAMQKSGGVKVGVDEYGNPKYAMSAGKVFSGAKQNKQRTDTPASTIAPYRDMQGYPVKLDDMYISGGLGKSAESKKQSDEAKRKASQPASTKGTGQAGGSFRVINGQVRFFGSGADTASEVEAVKPTGMR